MAMSFFTAHGDDKSAVEAAKQVTALDPANLDAARHVAHDELRSGDVKNAFGIYNSILRQQPADVEALNLAAREGRFALTKVSYGAIPYLLDRYRILRAGGALGRGCGPLVIARPRPDRDRLRDAAARTRERSELKAR